MPIYVESRDLDAPGGFIAEHQYLIYVPNGKELDYDEWEYIGAFPTDGDGSFLTRLGTGDFLFKDADADGWKIDEFTYFSDVIVVGTLLGKDPNDVTVSEMVAAGNYTGPVESIRHRELVNDESFQSEEDLWAYLIATADEISGEYTYNAQGITGTSSVEGPSLNSNSFISSILKHAYVAGHNINAFNTDANVVGSRSWLGTEADDVLDGRIQFANGHDAVDLFGGDGADTLIAGTSSSYLVAGADKLKDTLTGSQNNDILVGYFNQNSYAESDKMIGSGGNDKFVIIDPDAALPGGIPYKSDPAPAVTNFTYSVEDNSQYIFIDGGSGHDTLDYSFLSNDVTVDFTNGSIVDIEEYVGSKGDDEVYVDGDQYILDGGEGEDSLTYQQSGEAVLCNNI